VYEKVREIETLQKKPQNQLFLTSTQLVPMNVSECIDAGQSTDYMWTEA
jgi:hypothetical protein